MSKANGVKTPQKRLGIACAACLLMSAASGCATTGSNDCEWVEPIRPSAESVDAMSDETAQRILAHNEAWKGACQ